jgi:hypothetical protein
MEQSVREKARSSLFPPLTGDKLTLTTTSERTTSRDMRDFKRAMKNTKYHTVGHQVSVAPAVLRVKLHVM